MVKKHTLNIRARIQRYKHYRWISTYNGRGKRLINVSTHLQLQWGLLTLQHLLDLYRLLVEMLNVLLIGLDLILQSNEKFSLK